MIRNIFTALLLALSICTSFASNKVTPDPNFTVHYSFNKNPLRIMDTKDKVYFFVRQRIYDTTAYAAYFNMPACTIFVLDKNDPEQKLVDISNIAPLSSSRIYLCDADVETGTLAVVYDDGGVDVVLPDNSVIYIDNYKKRFATEDFSTTKTIAIKSVDIDPLRHEIWFGGTHGYMCVSGLTGSVLRDAKWFTQERIFGMTTVGDKLIALIEFEYYEAPSEGTAALRRSAFKKFEPAGGAESPAKVFPINDNKFGYYTDNGMIGVVTRAGDSWSWQNMAYLDNVIPAWPWFNKAERSITATGSGYLIASHSGIVSVNRPAAGTDEVTCETISSLPLNSAYVDTYDGKNFWFYNNPGEFVKYSYADGQWIKNGGAVKPNAPFHTAEMGFAYSPTAGFIATNRRPGYFQYDNFSVMDAAMPQSYRNGQWTDLSANRTMPQYIKDNNLESTYNSNLSTFPVDDPMGVYIDPVFPDVLHMGSVSRGLVSYNVADPMNKRPVWLTNKNRLFPGMESFAKTELFESSNNYAYVYNLGFDADNNLWAFQAGLGTANPRYLHFFYMTPEERRGMLESGDPTKSPSWHKILVPYDLDQTTKVHGIALKHPKNKGKLLIGSFTYAHGDLPIEIVDHHGRPDDPSAYTVSRVRFMLPDDGVKNNLYMADMFVENPLTGNVVVICYQGVYEIDLTQPVNVDVISGKKVNVSDVDGNLYAANEAGQGGCAAFDEYNRLWVGYTDGGLIGIDPDGRLVAAYDENNSPLPSNNIRSIGWNPETKSLFVSTMDGMVEIKVDAPRGSAGDGVTPYLSHSHVNADFAGVVTVRNVPAGAHLNVLDVTGHTVAVLAPPTHGVTFWNLLNADGNHVPTGRYSITDGDPNSTFGSLPITVTR